MDVRSTRKRLQKASPANGRRARSVARQPTSGTLTISTQGDSAGPATYSFRVGENGSVQPGATDATGPDVEDNIDGRQVVGEVRGANGQDIYDFSGGFEYFITGGPIQLEINGQTYAPRDLDGTAPAPGCTGDADCAGDRVCQDGSCVLPNDGGCGSDADCAGDRVCQNGECVLPDNGGGGGDGPLSSTQGKLALLALALVAGMALTGGSGGGSGRKKWSGSGRKKSTKSQK